MVREVDDVTHVGSRLARARAAAAVLALRARALRWGEWDSGSTLDELGLRLMGAEREGERLWGYLVSGAPRLGERDVARL